MELILRQTLTDDPYPDVALWRYGERFCLRINGVAAGGNVTFLDVQPAFIESLRDALLSAEFYVRTANDPKPQKTAPTYYYRIEFLDAEGNVIPQTQNFAQSITDEDLP
jgi:hypothetical protein